MFILATTAPSLARGWVEASREIPMPTVASRAPYHTLIDLTPIPIRVTAAWHKVPQVVPTVRLLEDHTLWRQMHFDDWKDVPPALRLRALTSMVERYSPVIRGPEVWSALTRYDWDLVPQPIRAAAYQRMVLHWVNRYRIGEEFGLPIMHVARTISAIVMAESWFEHRAINVNQWGNRDLGLAGCSNHCRRELARMAEQGALDFMLAEDVEYFDPLNGTRVAAVWFERELLKSGGDVDLAIAAYHRGLPRAGDELGAAYRANVTRLRSRYMETVGASRVWDLVMHLCDDVTRLEPMPFVHPGADLEPQSLVRSKSQLDRHPEEEA